VTVFRPDAAEIVTVVAVLTALVVTANVALVCPAGMTTEDGTCATAVLLLDNVTYVSKYCR
jgi:hypothetical protein